MLSKSRILNGVQCHKMLFLKKHFPELAGKLTEVQKHIFKTGHEVGKLAQKLFPGGVDATAGIGRPGRESLIKTEQLLEDGASVIYEATFANEVLLAAVDILRISNGNVEVYEVKSGSSLKEENILDAAIQLWLLEDLGFKVSNLCVITLNKDYHLDGELNIEQLFQFHNVLDEAQKWQNQMPLIISELMQVLRAENAPEINIGQHCLSPYECAFKAHCWKEVPQDSIFNIRLINKEKAFKLYSKGIKKMKELPESYKLSHLQKKQWELSTKNKTSFDKKAISGFLEKLEFPLYFLDFETFQAAVPLYQGTKPYQQFPFQYSLHVLDGPDSETRHFEFLAKNNIQDPRLALAESLCSQIGATGSILAYNMSFEKKVLSQLAKHLPSHQKKLSSFTERFQDLMIPFSKLWYYKPSMGGSASLKSVLPALLPKYSYVHLEIQDGQTASIYFLQSLKDQYSGSREQLRKGLLAYCKLDTLAMVEIYQHLNRQVLEQS